MRAVLPTTFAFILGLVLGACAQPAPHSPVDAHVAQAARMADETIALVQRDEDGDAHAYCAGVWVSRSLILTANHCVDDIRLGEVLEYLTRDDLPLTSRTMVPVAKEPGHDLALLFASNAPAHATASVSSDPVLQGMTVQTMGHSLGLTWSYSTGEISAIRPMAFGELDMTWIQANVPVSPGNSGGGLFDDQGQLIGITTGTLASNRAQLLNVFVHRDYIRDFLAANAQ